jgi:hypothetical protein
MANNKFMDIMKWKKIAARAKRADKNLEKVKNWEEGDKDYNDNVSVSDAWEYGNGWIDDWYDTVVENGLYELGGKKVHILYKSPRYNDGYDEGYNEIMNNLVKWGYSDCRIIQIDLDNNYNTLHASHLDWFVVAVVDGIKKMIVPYQNGSYIPTDDCWHEWNSIAGVDEEIEIDDVIDITGEDKVMSWDTFEYDKSNDMICLSWMLRSGDECGFDIRLANMKRIA